MIFAKLGTTQEPFYKIAYCLLSQVSSPNQIEFLYIGGHFEIFVSDFTIIATKEVFKKINHNIQSQLILDLENLINQFYKVNQNSKIS